VGVKDGIPEIAWVEVPGTNGAKVSFGKMGEFELQNFYISTYLVTHAQFQAFVEADDGYHNLTWWKGFPDDFQPQRLREAQSTFANAPRDRLSWYQCVAFTRWLDARLPPGATFAARQLPGALAHRVGVAMGDPKWGGEKELPVGRQMARGARQFSRGTLISHNGGRDVPTRGGSLWSVRHVRQLARVVFE
jgi:formylglycine-generating enzyme required for sulfatase activity